MARPTGPVWKMEAHTHGKHRVLARYLDQWLPKLMGSFPRVVFIDGFSGPGIYEGGELGSPLITLNAHRDHAYRANWNSELVCYFLDVDPRRMKILELEIAKRPVTPGVTVHTYSIEFHEAIAQMRAELKADAESLAPALVMVDPFGVKGVHMEDLAWVLSQRSGELYVTLMADHIARFCETSEFSDHLNALYGGSHWRVALKETEHVRRRDVLLDLLHAQLKQHASNVVRFSLYEGDSFKYAIFHASNHLKGCDAMKNAIWRTMPGGTYTFSGDHGQLSFDATDRANFTALAEEIAARADAAKWILIDDLLDWGRSDATRFHSGHVRRALKILEAAGRLEIRGDRRRAGEYPEGKVDVRVVAAAPAKPVRKPGKRD